MEKFKKNLDKVNKILKLVVPNRPSFYIDIDDSNGRWYRLHYKYHIIRASTEHTQKEALVKGYKFVEPDGNYIVTPSYKSYGKWRLNLTYILNLPLKSLTVFRDLKVGDQFIKFKMENTGFDPDDKKYSSLAFIEAHVVKATIPEPSISVKTTEVYYDTNKASFYANGDSLCLLVKPNKLTK